MNYSSSAATPKLRSIAIRSVYSLDFLVIVKKYYHLTDHGIEVIVDYCGSRGIALDVGAEAITGLDFR